MINTGNCPKCGKTVTAVNIEHIDIREAFATKWHGISLVCPDCHCVLGVSIDPIAIKNDLLEEIASTLRKGG